MTAPADQAVREQALDPQRSFIVQAPAGSGKTELLVQRYLRLLGRVNEPDAVVAITFTRKAAAEMRERVRDSLNLARDDQASVAPHRRLSLHLARRVLEHSSRRGWDLPNNPARLRIVTIDSLGSWLAAGAPVSSGGGALGQLTEKPRALYQQAARNLLYQGMREGDEDVRALLRRLGGKGSQFVQLVANMLAKREQWLPLLGGEQRSEALNESLAALVGQELERMLNRLGKGRERFESLFAEHWAAPGQDRRPGDPESLGAWENAAEDLLTKKGTWLRKFRKPVDPELAALIRGSEGFRERLERLTLLEKASYDGPRLLVVQSVLRVLRHAYAHLRVLFAQRRENDYTEISQAALRALEGSDRPSLLAERLDARLRHILVDEFQDTSRAQLMLLQRMTADWQDGDGRTLFVVGDPMQSIYSFREADVRGYLHVCEQGLGMLRPEVLKLTVNFRSAPSLIAWFNKAFPQVLPAVDDTLVGEVSYTACDPAPQADEDGAALDFHGFRQGDYREEAETVVNVVRQTLEEHPGGTIAVLVRKRRDGEEISNELERAGIPASRTDFERRDRFSVIQDLAALARALAQFSDRIAWLAVLRAPWCGLTLRDLHALCHDDRHAPVWELLCDSERHKRLSADGQARLAHVVPALEKVLSLKGQLDFRDWVEGAWLALGGAVGNPDQNALRHAREFLDALGEACRGSMMDDPVSRILELCDDYVSNPETDSPVQLLTMHKAKGLEFDTVILPGLGRDTASGGKSILRWWHPPPASAASSPLLAVAPSKRPAEDDPVYDYLNALERAREDAERRRLLYVAVTRARTRLHLVVGLKSKRGEQTTGELRPRARTMAKDLEDVLRVEMDGMELPDEQAGARTPELVHPAIRRVPRDWTPPELPAPPLAVPPPEIEGPTYAWAGEKARVLGLAVHRWLEEIAAEGPEAFPPQRLTSLRSNIQVFLQNSGIPGDELDTLTDDIETALANTLADERGRWLLARHEDACSELSLSHHDEGRTRSLILDRSFVYEGERWIVDYKTSRHEGGNLEGFLDEEERRYAAQLERYRLAMSQRETRPIRTALYFPWHRAFREVTP